jgi:hypothetical protein
VTSFHHVLGRARAAVWIGVWGCAATSAFAQASAPTSSQQTSPQAGLWSFDLSVSGTPRGTQSRKSQACVTQQALSAGATQALVSAAMDGMRAAGDDKDKADGKPPSCKFSNVKLEGAQTVWSATCEGPRGAMSGQGSGQFAALSADFKQQFEVQMMGKRTITQTVNAKRIGACP